MKRIFIGTALASCVVCAPAYAQSAAQDDGAQENDAGSTIVVTAQRREQDLQEVPVAVSAFSETTLSVAGITSSEALDVVTPGLTMTESVFVPQPVIRGISTRNRNPGDEASVPTFVNGIYQPWQYTAFFEYNNIERVEVLRGPQGTLFGRNATGGAINIVTRRPTFETSGEVSLTYGSFDSFKAEASLSTGLTDNVAIDIGAFFLDGGGYYTDINTGDSLGGHNSSWSTRAQILVDAGPTEILFSYTHSDIDNNLGFTGQPLNGNTLTVAPPFDPGQTLPQRPFEAAYSFVPETRQQLDTIGFTVRHDFGGVMLEALTGYSNATVRGQADIDASFFNAARFQPDMDHQAVTQALHLISDNDSDFQWIIGGFFMSDQSGYNPFGIRVLAPPPQTELTTEVDTEAWAGFAEGTYEFGGGFSLTAGLRYSYERKGFTGAVNGTQVTDTSESWSDLTPRIVLGWEASPDVNAYVSYSEAFKSGVYNSATLSPVPVNPEQLRAWEAGLKLTPNNDLRINLAAYLYDHRDLQITARAPGTAGTSVLINAARVRSYGLEGEFFYSPSPDLNINAGFSYLNSEYREFTDATVFTPNFVNGMPIGNSPSFLDASGLRNTKSPEWTFFVGGSYTHQIGDGTLTIGGNVAFEDEFSWEPDGRILNPSHFDISASLTWEPDDGAYQISVFGANLADERYFSSVVISPLADDVRYARPRTFGIRLSVPY